MLDELADVIDSVAVWLKMDNPHTQHFSPVTDIPYGNLSLLTKG